MRYQNYSLLAQLQQSNKQYFSWFLILHKYSFFHRRIIHSEKFFILIFNLVICKKFKIKSIERKNETAIILVIWQFVLI